MKNTKRIMSLLLSAVLLVSLLMPGSVRADAGFTSVGGWLESLYAELSGVTDAQVTAVRYDGPMSGELTGEDFTYLVRDTEKGVRIDIPGLIPGSYSLTVTTSDGEFTQENITVQAHDRSGYAHFGYTRGVGAYKDDGTVKDNAIILYVTDENKDTVTVTAKDGTTVSGIGNILNSGGKDVGNGTSNKGGLANTNQDILRKLAMDGTPLVVRIVGTVGAPEGLTAWGAIDYGGNEDDNGSMARMQATRDITIEGIGNDAVVNGWGFSVICQSGNRAAGLGESFEFRNITFMNVPEDCIGMEGTQNGSTLTDPIERCWVHNCAFYGPTNVKDASDDQDKGGGDGACDFKRGQYYTMSYCYYYGYHKTNLIGGSDSNLQYHITWHHNYYKNCESRAPLARQADMHLYNNLFEGQSSYCMSLRANTYIFSEYNVYLNCKKVTDNKGKGVCKSYMNTFSNCTGTTNSDMVTVSDKTQTVSSQNKYANFDTNEELAYVASGNYSLDTDNETLRQKINDYAGAMDCSFTAPSVPDVTPPEDIPDGTDPIIPDPGNPETPDTIPEGSYIHNFTENGLESDFYTINGNLSDSKGTVTYNGLTLTVALKIESSTSISFTAPEAGQLVMVMGVEVDNAAGNKIKVDGENYIVGSDCTLTVNIGAGAHTVTKNKYMHMFYLAYIPASAQHTHTWQEATCTTPATCAECGQTDGEALGHIPGEAVRVEATCTQDGSVEAILCSVCQVELEPARILPATGHSWSEPVITAEPTEEADGAYVKTCASCGEQESGIIDNNPFVDVKADRFESAILWAYYNGITTGTGDGTTFSPEDTCTRKQIVTFLWRAAGEPEPKNTVNPFSDVKQDRFEKAILWAYYEGITTGTGDGTTFSPEDTCTRKQIVTFLWRFFDEPAPASQRNGFTDIKADRFAAAILWAYYEGITTGTGDGTTFSPEDPCTRKQIVTFLYRAMKDGVQLQKPEIVEEVAPQLPTLWTNVSGEGVGIWSNPNEDRYLKTLPAGRNVTVLGWSEKYAFVEYAGKKGYVFATYLEPAEDPQFTDFLKLVTPTTEYSYDAMRSDMQTLCQRYPALMSIESIGTSELGRDIPVLIVGNKNARHHVLIQAAIHGREHMTAWLVMAMTEYWTRFDLEALGDVCWHIIPMSNPDGVMISQMEELNDQQRSIYYRDKSVGFTTFNEKNYARRWKANGLGIDLNRNFDANWSEVGTSMSGKPASENYKGASVFCAKESIALRDYTLRYDFDITVSYHASGSVLYYGFNYRGSDELAKTLYAVTGYELLGNRGVRGGGYKDWAESLDIPSITVEIGCLEAPLADYELPSIFARNLNVLPAIAKLLQEQ